MDVIYGLIPGMILMGLVGVAVFFWAAKSGQFDDMQGEAHRILMDDDLEDEVALSGAAGRAEDQPVAEQQQRDAVLDAGSPGSEPLDSKPLDPSTHARDAAERNR